MPDEVPAALATTSELESALMRPLTDAEAQYAATFLRRAESLILVRLPDLRTRATGNADFAFLVAGIEAEMVARVFRNPEGLRREEQGNYSYQVDVAVASGRLSVLPDEWNALGVGNVIGSIAGAMDGYAAARYGNARPDLAFQYGWPAS